jgi:hypothetical protein
MSRAELTSEVMAKTAPFYFYVDEFQNFANESFASILSEARKYKLCLTVANQFIAQMEETIRDAVFGNMGTTAAFRVGPLDAEFMEKVFAPVFTQEDLQNTQFGQYYITLQIDNMGSKPFSAQGLGPIPPPEISMRKQVVEASRKNFSAPREVVEQSVKEFFGYNHAKTIHSESVVTPQSRSDTYRASEPKEHILEKKSNEPRLTTPPKPIVPVSGYVPQKSVQSRPPMTPKPVENSASLNDLLSRFDDAVVVAPTVSPTLVKFQTQAQKPKPFVTPTPASKAVPYQKPIPPAKFVQDLIPQVQPQKKSFPPAEQKIVPQKMDRAASPEKKSALAEVLAKAMIHKTETKIVEENIPWQVPEIETTKVEPETFTESAPPDPVVTPAVAIEIPELDPAPKTTETEMAQIPKPIQSNTLREVPEDILRKVLE